MNPQRLSSGSRIPNGPGRMLCLWALWVLLSTSTVQARELDMREYITLRTGMNQAEVLYRLGPPDFQNTCYDCGGFIVNNAFGPYFPYGYSPVQPLAPMEVWYYIPNEYSPRGWISEVIFDRTGRVFRLRRNRPYP